MSPAFTIYNAEIHFRDLQKHLYILTKHVECFISNLLKNKNSVIQWFIMIQKHLSVLLVFYYKFEEEREGSKDYSNAREYICIIVVKFGITNS